MKTLKLSLSTLFIMTLNCLSFNISHTSFVENVQFGTDMGVMFAKATTKGLLGLNYPSKEITIEHLSPEDLANKLKEITKDSLSEFIWGASTSEHQCSPQCVPQPGKPHTCSFAWWAQMHNLPQPHPNNGYHMNLWNNYSEYTKYASQTLQHTGMRISIEWALVQPHGPQSYDQDALDHYADLYIDLLKKDITPLVCFHHYTDPIWFINRGGFEKTTNIPYFSLFATKVYSHIMKRIENNPEALNQLRVLGLKRPPLWATFNSAVGYANKVYRSQEHPQAQNRYKLLKQSNGITKLVAIKDKIKLGIGWFVHVIDNLNKSHVAVYDAIKKAHKNEFPAVPEPQIGLLHNVHQLHPKDPLDTKSHITCAVGNEIQDGRTVNFFNSLAQRKLDFIGINYYSNGYMDGSKKVVETRPEYATNNSNYRIYPEGLYQALVDNKIAKKWNIPMYVTENGISVDNTPEGFEKRNKFFQEYLYAIYKALQAGADVRGYLTWTLADNYEWPKMDPTTGKQKDRRIYGLCTVADNGKRIEIKNPSDYYYNFVKQFQNSTVS